MAGYIGTQPVPQGIQIRGTITATAGQTTFSTSGFSPGFVDVYLNGVKLVRLSDFTDDNGSDIILTTGANQDDTLEYVAFSTFEVASVVPPIGATYVQFPGFDEPGTLWSATTWQMHFDNEEGVFFRTEGTEALAFGGGKQNDAIQSHSHNVRLNNYDFSGGSQGPYPSSGTYIAGTGSVFSAWGTENTGGSETRPTNYTIRVWERIA